MSLAISYADTQYFLKKNPKLHQAFHVLRKAQIRQDRLILEHAVITVLIDASTPLELWYIQSLLKYSFHLEASRRRIKRFILKPLCKERYVMLIFERKSGENKEQNRFYASTLDLKEYRGILEEQIIAQIAVYA